MATELPNLMLGSRQIPPPKPLTDAISEAIDRVYGPGYSFRVRAGLVDQPRGTSEASSSGRHVTERYGSRGAADVQIYSPRGRQLRGRDLLALAKFSGHRIDIAGDLKGDEHLRRDQQIQRPVPGFQTWDVAAVRQEFLENRPPAASQVEGAGSMPQREIQRHIRDIRAIVVGANDVVSRCRR